MKQILMMAALAFGLVGCVPMQQPMQQSNAPQAQYAVGTGIYVNGTEITAKDRADLEMVLGERVAPGRYAMDADYNFGYEGSPQRVNLRMMAQAKFGTRDNTRDRGSEPGSIMTSRDPSGQTSTVVQQGDCIMMSTPDGSVSSGC